MKSLFIIINIILVLTTVIQARHRAQIKGVRSLTSRSVGSQSQETNNDETFIHSKEDTPTEHLANEEQIEQFTRLLFDRLNLKEPPNVTSNLNDDVNFPPPIFKQLEQQAKEQQRIHDNEEYNFYRQQKVKDENKATAERAILPGTYVSNNTCRWQLAMKYNLSESHFLNIDCFRFTNSPKESKSLPTDQSINQLRLYIKKDYFLISENQQGPLTEDMFHIYQIFRPALTNTSQIPLSSGTGTMRIPISQVKELNENWFELIFETEDGDFSIQSLYNQLLSPWYALAIDRNVQMPSLPMRRSLLSFNRHYYRQYHKKKYRSYSLRSENGFDNNKDYQEYLPYMLVEYGQKISSSGRRGTRDVPARPAFGCHPTSPCCRRTLTIDLDQGINALNFVIHPRKLDIGECVGLCGTSGSSLKYIESKNAQHRNEPNSAYNLLLLHSNFYLNRNTTQNEINPIDQHSTQCCSYSRTGGLEVMYTTTNGGPIIRKFIPNMVVEECKCGLPATIQQV